jgi:hypothetical protein
MMIPAAFQRILGLCGEHPLFTGGLASATSLSHLSVLMVH